MNQTSEPLYEIPMRYRKMENMHIIFWLLKDISWCLFWKPLGIAMIFPTLIISIIIAWRTRHIRSELSHNMAITFWIAANSYWMISEFFHFDETILFYGIEGKYVAVLPFVIGLLFLVYHYVFPKNEDAAAPTIATR